MRNIKLTVPLKYMYNILQRYALKRDVQQLKAKGELRHGSGVHKYGDWGIWL